MAMAIITISDPVKAGQPQNMIKNPGFEKKALNWDFPASWTESNQGMRPAIFSEKALSDKFSCRLIGDGKTRGWRQRIEPVTAKRLRLRAFIKVKNLKIQSGEYVRVNCLVFYKNRPEKDATVSAINLRSLPDNYDWQRFIKIINAKDDLEISHVFVTVEGKFSGGSVWIDDIALEDAPWLDKRGVLKRRIHDVISNLDRVGYVDQTVPAALELLKQADKLAKTDKADLKTANELYVNGVKQISPDVWAAVYPDIRTDKKIEARMIYHGNSTTAQGINRHLDTAEALGCNAMYLSLGGWKAVCYRSDLIPIIQAYDQDPDFDALAYIIEQGHKRGIKIFAYLAAFHQVKEPPTKGIYLEHPEWFAKAPRKMAIFPDPANLEVQEFMARAFCELAQRYDLDGVGLDYIRYPNNGDLNYDQNNRKQIMDRFAIDILKKDPWTAKDNSWSKIQQYRADKVTEAVKRIVTEVHKVKPGTHFLASVFTHPDYALNAVGQDWGQWSELGLVGLMSPMNYGYAPTEQNEGMEAHVLHWQRDVCSRGDALYVPAIGGMPNVHEYWTITEWAQSAAMQRKIGCDGFIIYRIGEVDPAMVDFFGKGPFYGKTAFPDFPAK